METLSQDDIDRVLSTTGVTDQKKIQIYDFRRPDKFGKPQIRNLSAIHENWAHQLATTLSKAIRTVAAVHIASVDQVPFEEFVRSVPNPTSAVVFELQPLPGYCLMELDPALTRCMVDRKMGGTGASEDLYREHTEIEQRVLTDLYRNVLSDLDDAWARVKPVHAHFVRVESNPAFAAIVPPEEMVALVTLEVAVGETTSSINLCLPAITLAPILDALCLTFSGRKFSPRPVGAGVEFFADVKVLTQVHCPIPNESLSSVSKLRKGVLVQIPDFSGLSSRWEAGGTPLGLLDVATRKVSPTGHPVAMGILAAVPELDLSVIDDDVVVEDPSFEFLTMVDPGHLEGLLKLETPQTVALVLASLPPSAAGRIWAGLENPFQQEVAQMISNQQSVSERVLGAVASVLRKHLVGPSDEATKHFGGPEYLEALKTHAGQS